MQPKNFSIVIPAELEKSDNGSYKIRGLASTSKLDKEGEIIIPAGVDLSPISEGDGRITWDHGTGPEDYIGTLSGYTMVKDGFYLEGNLFKKHTRAKAVREVIESLDGREKGRLGLSIEGIIVERDPTQPHIVKRCIIDSVAVTASPVNTDTYVNLVKSLTNKDSSIEFSPKETVYNADQVLDWVVKALGVGAGSLAAPDTRSGGDALVMENLGSKKKKKKKSDISKNFHYEEGMGSILGQLQTLYPSYTRDQLWIALKDRLTTKFPS